jgi:probable rRNA maturation factor
MMRRTPPPAMRGLRVEVLRQARGRGALPSAREIGRWASAALGRRARRAELTVRLVGAGESSRLNGRYRGRHRPTNVLSFPVELTASPGALAQPLGDLVICPRIVREEARRQGKTVRAHWAHLVVHGALHLIGYDHERPLDARRMERREIAVLKRLGFANPYRSF